jgi:hypothetical protein
MGATFEFTFWPRATGYARISPPSTNSVWSTNSAGHHSSRLYKTPLSPFERLLLNRSQLFSLALEPFHILSDCRNDAIWWHHLETMGTLTAQSLLVLCVWGCDLTGTKGMATGSWSRQACESNYNHYGKVAAQCLQCANDWDIIKYWFGKK